VPAGADAAADRELAESQAVTGDDDVARILARGHGGQRDAVGRSRRQVLERVHGEIDLAGEQGVAQGVHEHAGATEAGQRRGRHVAVGADRDQDHVAAGALGEQLGDQAALGAGELGGTGAQSQDAHHTPSTRVTASTASGSSANSSARAVA